MEQIIQAFRRFDIDDDGTLTFDELLHVMDRIAPDQFSVEDIVTIFDQMDIDEDDTIQYEEFVHWCCNEGEGPVVDAVLELANRAAEPVGRGRRRVRVRGPEEPVECGRRRGRGRVRGGESFPISDEPVCLPPVERGRFHTEVTPFHREGLGFEGGHKAVYDGGFYEVNSRFGAVSKSKYGHDGDVVEVEGSLGIGVGMKHGLTIGTDRNERAEVSYGFGQGVGYGVGSKAGTDRTGATIAEMSAAGFGAGFSCGGDHTFGIKVKAFGYDVGFKLTLKGLLPTNGIERPELQSTYKPVPFRNTKTAAKNYAKGLIKKDKKHRFCTITEWSAVPAHHFTVKVYDVPHDRPASFSVWDGKHEVVYDEDEFISKDFVQGEFLKIDSNSLRPSRRPARRGVVPKLMSQVGYTEELSDFIIEPLDDMIMLRSPVEVSSTESYVTVSDSEVTLGPEGTAFKVRPVEDRSGRFVLEPEGYTGSFIGRSDGNFVGPIENVREAQMRAIPTGQWEGYRTFAIRFGA